MVALSLRLGPRMSSGRLHTPSHLSLARGPQIAGRRRLRGGRLGWSSTKSPAMSLPNDRSLRATDGPWAQSRPLRTWSGRESELPRVPSQPRTAPAAAEAPGERTSPAQRDGCAGARLAPRLAAPEPPVLQRALPSPARRPALRAGRPEWSLGSSGIRSRSPAACALPARPVGTARLRRGCGEEAVPFPWPEPRSESRCAGRGRLAGRMECLGAAVMEAAGFAGRWGHGARCSAVVSAEEVVSRKAERQRGWREAFLLPWGGGESESLGEGCCCF